MSAENLDKLKALVADCDALGEEQVAFCFLMHFFLNKLKLTRKFFFKINRRNTMTNLH